MPREQKKCRVCGKLYTACRTVNPVPGAYNWREVACSPECSMEYIRRVTEARGKDKALTEAEAEAQTETQTEGQAKPGAVVEVQDACCVPDEEAFGQCEE